MAAQYTFCAALQGELRNYVYNILLDMHTECPSNAVVSYLHGNRTIRNEIATVILGKNSRLGQLFSLDLCAPNTSLLEENMAKVQR